MKQLKITEILGIISVMMIIRFAIWYFDSSVSSSVSRENAALLTGYLGVGVALTIYSAFKK